MTDFDELEKLARAATPGPWKIATGAWMAGSEHGGWVEAERATGRYYKVGDEFIPEPAQGVKICTFRSERATKRVPPDASPDAAFIAAANPATILALLSANREMRGSLEGAAKYLCRLEGALLADDLDMKLNFPGEPSPTAMAESILRGFDSIEYDIARSALTTQRGDGE